MTPPHAGARPGRALGLLVTVTVASTVFNDMPPLVPAGEMSKDPFILLFPVLGLVLLLRPGEIRLSATLLALAAAFAVAIVASVAHNWDEIASARFQGRGGIGRVFSQSLIVAFGLGVALAFYHLTARGCLPAVIRGAKLGLAIMLSVGLLEFGSWFSIPVVTQIYDALSLVIHYDNHGFYPHRLRTTAFEVSWAAVMLTFIFPFALAGATGAARATLLAGATGLVALSESRTAMLVFALQIAIYVLGSCRGRADRLVAVSAAACLVLFGGMQVPSAGREVATVVSNLVEYGNPRGPYEASVGDENISNITRLAHIRMGLEMFEERPAFGVGFGQYGFHYAEHVTAEDMRSWEIRAHLSADPGEHGWPPIYSNHVRVLAETGAFGFAAWVALLAVPLIGSARRARGDSAEGRQHLAVVMTLVGWIALGASIDSFRFFGGFVAIGVALALARERAGQLVPHSPQPAG